MNQLELQKKLGERITNLSRTDISNEELAHEIERSKAMASIAKEMVRNANLIIMAKKSIGDLSKSFVDEFI